MREEMTTLGESCQFFNGKAHEKDIDKEGQFVVVNSKFISSDGEVKKFTAKQMFPLVEDDIVMVMSDVPNGKALAKCYVIEENDKYSLNQRICAIRTTEFNIRFLYYQLNRHPYLLAFNNGENQTNLRKGDILNCPLWKPTLDIQEQILKILDEALDHIDQAQANIEKNIENAKELFENWTFQTIKNANWNTINWGEVCDFTRGPFGGSLKKSMFVESGYAVYEQKQAIHNDYVALRYFVDEEKFQEMKRFEVKPADLLMSCSGVTLGRISEVPEDAPKGIINQALLKLTAKPDKVLNDFLVIWIRSKIFQDLIFKVAGGAAQPNVPGVKILKNIKLPCPTISEQEDFIELYDSMKEFTENSITANIRKNESLEDLKKSILQKAFSGALTVSNHD
jgi:type I restriction enzyme S subunit